MSSIFDDIKSALGIDKKETAFDYELLMLINASIGKLNQAGLGINLEVKDGEQKWQDLTDEAAPGNDADDVFHFLLPMIKTYLYLDVKLIFDPPQPAYAMTSTQEYTKELYWRLREEFGWKEVTDDA